MPLSSQQWGSSGWRSPGTCCPANLANWWAPGSVRDPASITQGAEGSRTKPDANLWPRYTHTYTYMYNYTHMHVYTQINTETSSTFYWHLNTADQASRRGGQSGWVLSSQVKTVQRYLVNRDQRKPPQLAWAVTPNDCKGETTTAQSSFQDLSLYITPLTTHRPSANYEGPQGARGTTK